MRYLLYFLPLLLFSCNSLYKATTLNVPLHEKAGDFQIAANYGASGGDLQLSAAVTNSIYISANGQFFRKKTKEDSVSLYKSFDLALGYYKWLNADKTIKLDMAAGYGPGDLDYHFLVQTIPMQLRFHVSSFYHRWYLQPSLGFNTNDTDLAISMRSVVIHHSRFTDHYNRQLNEVSYNPIAYLEPALTIRKGVKNFKITGQAGLIWPLTPRHQLVKPVIMAYGSVGINIRFNLLPRKNSGTDF